MLNVPQFAGIQMVKNYSEDFLMEKLEYGTFPINQIEKKLKYFYILFIILII